MDQERRHRIASVERDLSPAELRAAIAETRASLARNLHALKDHLLHPFAQSDPAGDTSMPTEKKARTKAKKSSDKRENGSKANGATKTKAKAKTKSSAKSTARGKSSTSRAKSGGRTKALQGIVARTGEVLDPVLAGAVVGAITGAARSVAKEPTAVPLCDPDTGTMPQPVAGAEGSSTTEVLSELTSGAAMGAVAGAAKAVVSSSEGVANIAQAVVGGSAGTGSAPAGGKKKSRR